MAVVIGLLVLIFMAIFAPRFLGFVFGLIGLYIVGAILFDGNSHPILYTAIGISVVYYFIGGMRSARNSD